MDEFIGGLLDPDAEFGYDPEEALNRWESINDALAGLPFKILDQGGRMEPRRYFYEVLYLEGDQVGFLGKGKDGLWYAGHFNDAHLIMKRPNWRVALAELLNHEVDIRLGIV